MEICEVGFETNIVLKKDNMMLASLLFVLALSFAQLHETLFDIFTASAGSTIEIHYNKRIRASFFQVMLQFILAINLLHLHQRGLSQLLQVQFLMDVS